MNILRYAHQRFLYCFIVVLLVSAGDTFAQLQGDTFASAKQKREARLVYYYNETPGYVEKDAGGNLSGFCIDLMQAFGLWLKKYEGIELKPVFQGEESRNFKLYLENIRSAKGGVLGIGSITITEERKKALSFSSPFITNVAVLITHKNAPALGAKKDIATAFAGMQAVAVKATTSENWLLRLRKELYPALNIQYVNAGNEALELVSKNPKLFTQLDFIFYLKALDAGMPIVRHAAADETSQSLGIVMPLNSDWTPALNRFMKAFVNSNEYRRIVSKNLGPNALKLLDSVAATQ